MERFEELISSYIANRIGVSNNFLSEDLTRNLRNNMFALLKEDELKLAGIGHLGSFSKNNEIRSDVIYWLDKKNNNPHEMEFFKQIDDFKFFY